MAKFKPKQPFYTVGLKIVIYLWCCWIK